MVRTRSSRCSAVSANRTDILLPVSFHPRTMRQCKRSMISSAPLRVSNLYTIIVLSKTKKNRTQERTYRTNAIILGGLLSFV